MSALVAIFAQIGGITVTCQTLQTLAAQFNCLPPSSQLPALIYLATQILANGPGSTQVFSGPFGGVTPNFTPSVSTALLVDTTIPNDFAFWAWANNTWTELISQ